MCYSPWGHKDLNMTERLSIQGQQAFGACIIFLLHSMGLILQLLQQKKTEISLLFC